MKANGRPLRRLRDEVERLGVRIFALPVPHDAFSGFSFWHSGYGPCILVNAKDPPGRRNFTLAHELAHLVYRQGSSVCYLPINPGNTYGHLEYRANQLAVELLMPEQGVVRNFHEVGLSLRPSEQELARFASRWGVSLQAMGYRLENLGLIEKGLIDEMLESWPKFMKRSKTPRWERQLGQRFVQVAFEAYQKGLISSGKLARTLGLTVRKVLEEADKRAS